MIFNYMNLTELSTEKKSTKWVAISYSTDTNLKPSETREFLISTIFNPDTF